MFLPSFWLNYICQYPFLSRSLLKKTKTKTDRQKLKCDNLFERYKPQVRWVRQEAWIVLLLCLLLPHDLQRETKSHRANEFACHVGIQWKVHCRENLEITDRGKKRKMYLFGFLQSPVSHWPFHFQVVSSSSPVAA